MVNNVYVSAVTKDNISRHELLAWVNDSLQANLSKIEEMSTGAAYCQLTDFLFRDSVPLRKVKWNSRSEVDWINNWKLVQTTWKQLGVDKPVPVEKLLKAKFQENFEFLQWFKKFFDANCSDLSEYDAIAVRGGEPLPAGAKGPATARSAALAPAVSKSSPRSSAAPSLATKSNTATTNAAFPAKRALGAAAKASTAAPPPKPKAPAAKAAVVDESAANELAECHATIHDMESRLEAFVEALTAVEKERDSYYHKLRRVEDMITALPETERNVDGNIVLQILYEQEDGEELNGEDVENQAAPHDTTATPPQLPEEKKIVTDDETF